MPPDPPSSLSPAPRWSVERRLDFIASRLTWEGRINRQDLVARFGVSPNQATADLARFEALNPGALIYDTRGKTYRAGGSLPAPSDEAARDLLRDMRLIAEGVVPAEDGILAFPPAAALAEPPTRLVSPGVLRAIITAIRDHRRLSAIYQSFSAPESKRRDLEPHALVFDGFRWHARARDVVENRFKDYVLGRLSEPTDAGSASGSGEADVEWRTLVTLEILPHPGLSPAQRSAVEADYGMTQGRLVLTCRQAVAYYVKRRLGLTEGHETRRPVDQHIILGQGG